MSSAFTVTVILAARPALEAALRSELLHVVQAERAAATPHGLSGMALHEDPGRPGRFLLLEHWSSREAFEGFHAAHRPPELSAFLQQADRLLAEPLGAGVAFWRPLDAAPDAGATG